jgi:hypothetical protein
MRFAAFAGLLAAMTVPLLACSTTSSGGGASPEAGTGDESAVVSCADPREQTYAAGMQVKGDKGVFTFVLVSSDPAPPASETNVWVLKVLDASGAPVTGAQLASVTPTMPLMSHGTSKPTVVANGDGSFDVTGIYLFMAGLWQVTIDATSGSDQDSGSFYFCVAG